jgi:hypothetical protein
MLIRHNSTDRAACPVAGVSGPRRGMVLLVVLAMLSLFSATALAFVFYADAESVAAQMARESLVKTQADIDTELLAAYFLSQLIYDTDNVNSALRGWSLARSMYGYNPSVLNFTPYNGIGRKAVSAPVLFGGPPPATIDNVNLINYQLFTGVNPNDPYTNLQRNPEWYGKAGDPNFRYVGGANPPWTTYDTNSLFLAEVTADGNLLMPSFVRPWNAAGANVNSIKYQTLRPHATWNPQLVTPDSEVDAATGVIYDVRNQEIGPGRPGGGNNDSSWIDLGFPVMTAPNGKRYKPLFAPMIVDLANRLHLWAHGNRLGAGGTSVSNQGMGAPEVNLSLLPNLPANPSEYQNLMDDRYGGPGALPAGSPPTAANSFGYPGFRPWYAKIDADGNSGGTSSMQPLTGFATTSTVGVPAGVQTMSVNYANMPGGFPWAFLPGMPLTIDFGTPQQETVVVMPAPAPTPTTFTAAFTKGHPAPATVAFSSLLPFPNYPSGWDNAFNGGVPPDEITQKPLGMNIYNLPVPGLTPQGPPPLANMEALLRFRGTNAPALTSAQFRRMPGTFSNPRACGLATLWNLHLDRITASPLIPWDRTAVTPPGGGPYQYTGSYPKVTAFPYPFPAPTYGTPNTYPATSEFTADWRSNLGTRLRLNLNRTLTEYPPQNAAGIIDTTNAAVVAQYNQAVADRVAFARAIYRSFIRITGAQDPNVPALAGMAPTSPEYKAARWLAQLAVNLVDYIDNDDYSTPFPWEPTGTDIVMGTELPRLVLNEIYAQRDNDGKGNGKGKGKGVGLLTQDVNMWVELHNPLNSTPAGSAYPRDGGAARLVLNGNAIYQIVFCVSNPALTLYLRDPANNRGDLDAASAALANTIMDWVETPANPLSEVVLPAGGAGSGPPGSNQGYYVVGPPPNYTPASDPHLPTTTHLSAWMSLNLDNAVAAPAVTVLLRRLACPHLPPQPNPALPLYNPYMTVDYVDNVPTADFRQNNGTGNGNNVGKPAFGRRHPYTAFNNTPAPGNSQIVAQTGGAGNQPANTFFSANNPNDAPFAWLTHLDRPLVNQLEVLHASGFKPHELTQQFAVNRNYFQHYAPWNDPTTLLYRSLDVLGTPNNMLGSIRGGRWHGNININTLNDLEVAMALCDPQGTQPYSAFSQADVQNILTKIIVSRTGNPAANYAPAGLPMPNGEGKPFQSFAAGNILDTVFRPDPTNPGQPLFAVGAGTNHPYQRAALLQKIFNNITTTSNVFAVWWTVGYFEVVDESVRPARLGAEIGRSENRHIRHRFFAIVDRSGLQLFNTSSTSGVAVWNVTQPYVVGNVVSYNGTNYTCAIPNTGIAPSVAGYWAPGALTTMSAAAPVPASTSAGLPIVLQQGMLLEIDSGANAEVVTVTGVLPGNQFTANFTFSHAPGVPIVCRGNPGPWITNYNPRKDTSVVLHMTVIQ